MTLEQINRRIQGFTNAIGGLTLSEILRFIEDVRAFIAENPGTAWVDHIGDDSALSVACYELSEDEVRSLQ